MDQDHPTSDNPATGLEHEGEAARRERIAWEAVQVAQARASVAAGRVVAEAAVDAWIDSLGTDEELPPPRSGR